MRNRRVRRVRRVRAARAALALLSCAVPVPAAWAPLARAATVLEAPAWEAPGFHYTGGRRVAPGVVFRTFRTTGTGGPVLGVLLDVDLTDPHVTAGLLHPPSVAARETVSRMVAAQHAVAGVNGDFFNIADRHPGVRPTGAAVGPEVAYGRALKGAVPDAQRFGPAPPPGSTTEEVIGVGTDRTARITTLHLTGAISVHGPLAPSAPPAGPPGPHGPLGSHGPLGPHVPPWAGDEPGDDLGDDPGDEEDAAEDAADARDFPSGERVATPRAARSRNESLGIPVQGLNQYALPAGGVGVFTSHWGTASRERAVCGSDHRRRDPCTADAAEVTVRHGVVTRVSATVGAGPIPAGTTVLVGREAGAVTLRRLRPGDRVRVAYRLAGPVRFRFAVGGFPVLRAGEPLPGLDARVRAARTAAGVSRNGRHLYLVVAESRSSRSTGLTLAGLATLLHLIGAHDAMNLDGGGSSTFTLRAPGEKAAALRNRPSAGRERAVANGIGVFVHR